MKKLLASTILAAAILGGTGAASAQESCGKITIS